MNPIVHGELSWLLACPLSSRRDRGLVTLVGLLPDVDGLTLLGGVDAYGTYHHVLTHGLLAAGVAVAGAALLAEDRLRVALGAAMAFHLHLVCDLAGSGPGWPILYFWPASHHEWMWSWQWDLGSWQNVLIGLATTVACLWVGLRAGRTPLELLSRRADGLVVAALVRRFGRAT